MRSVNILVVTSLVVLFSGLLAGTECSLAHLVYYMDFEQECTVGHVYLQPGQKATLNGKKWRVGSEVETCNITIQSPEGFDFGFTYGSIDTCDITLSIRAGSTVESTLIKSYTCGDTFPLTTTHYTETYLTIALRQTHLESHPYQFQLELTGSQAIEIGLTTTTITIIAVSAVVGLLLLILLAVAIWYCHRRNRQQITSPPVVYTATSQMT